jgi:hypothetical protein
MHGRKGGAKAEGLRFYTTRSRPKTLCAIYPAYRLSRNGGFVARQVQTSWHPAAFGA